MSLFFQNYEMNNLVVKIGRNAGTKMMPRFVIGCISINNNVCLVCCFTVTLSQFVLGGIFF